ncbi:MAG TPA: alpha/beta hydrolase [Pyrinomonadaceae bacterium]|jgi:pimeloyl-ACP methyl ester carboxylesterase|nr:alpha/beta hydrolase [Pyrinomonadaceae bacterium]
MATFVLVPGFWLGGWAWKDVTKILRERGHEVFPITLTGLGEKAHLASAETNLDTHAADVINLIKYNELEDVYLAGHSYGGVLITQVADRIPEKLAKLIYIDSAPLSDGAAHADFYSPEQIEKFERSMRAGGTDWQLPLPSWEDLDEGNNIKDLTEDDKKLIEKLATPQPFNASRQKLSLKNPKRLDLPKLAIWCESGSDEINELLKQDLPLFSELKDPNFEFVDLPTGHYPMFSRASELAELLDKSVK